MPEFALALETEPTVTHDDSDVVCRHGNLILQSVNGGGGDLVVCAQRDRLDIDLVRNRANSRDWLDDLLGAPLVRKCWDMSSECDHAVLDGHPDLGVIYARI